MSEDTRKMCLILIRGFRFIAKLLEEFIKKEK